MPPHVGEKYGLDATLTIFQTVSPGTWVNYIECDNKDTLIPRRSRDLFEDFHIPIPIAVTAVAHLAALLIGGTLLWFYRHPILTHLGRLGMTLLVLGLAGFFLFFVLNIALIVSRLLLF